MSRLLRGGMALLAAGCASVAEVRSSDPGFTPEALRKGGLAVLGVVQVNEVPQVRPPLIEALERVLEATRRDVPLVPARRAQAAMDDSTSRLLLLGYQMHGHADPAWLARAADSLRGLARYGVLARVVSDAVRHSARTDPATRPEQRSPTGRIRVTGRDARVSVHVYELSTRALVFGGTYAGWSEAAVTDSFPAPLEGPPSRGITIGASPREPPAQGQADPPPLARAVEPAFLEFARSLPGGPPP